MTRLTGYFLPTTKEAPADAEAASHRLLVRAGMVRQVGSGLWSWLPAGWRVQRRITRIVREEMDAIGGQEMLMPVLQPAELWRRSGRYESVGAELFRLRDRREAELVLAMTHEEAVTAHVAQAVRSYRDLPLILYHVQVKERDEPRPRAGVLRTREFQMKDSYTFDRDAEGLEAGYRAHLEAYDRILERCGIEYYRVESDVGMMGGHGAHEYMAPAPAGENAVALAPGYAANVEVASAEPRPVELAPADGACEEVPTPGLTTVEQVSDALGVPAAALLKAFPVVVEGRGLVCVLVRGDHRVNEVKLQNAVGAAFRPARAEELWAPGGYLGPVGADVPVLLDDAVAGDRAYVTGGNRSDVHLRGVAPGRDFSFERADVRTVEAGDTVGGQEVRIEAAIEVANVFKLGTRYSDPLGATYSDDHGREHPIWMGSYGLGMARVAAAAVEQRADERGIAWPPAIAPWDIALVGLGRVGSAEERFAGALYDELSTLGADVVYDDRDAGPGEKLADSELVGCPLRLTVGRRALGAGEVEATIRCGMGSERLPADRAAQAALELWHGLR